MYRTGEDISYLCGEAIDSIVCDKDNGLVWKDNAPYRARFDLDDPETFDTIIIMNGVGKPDHEVNGIKVEVLMLNIWQHIKEEVKVGEDPNAYMTSDGSLSLSRSQEYLQITFKPVEKVTAIRIELKQTRDKSAIINEVLVPREWKHL